jgi:hypothetical protein
MSKILILATSAAVTLGAVAVTSNAEARHMRASFGYYGYYGYAPGYFAPRGFRENPMYAPDAPVPRSYDNPGIPDFQDGSRG